MIDLRHGDCLEIMPTLASGSIDMILCDLPYGTTACKWDVIIPFEPLWKEYKRIIKKNGAIVLTASQPFTSALVMSNPEMFRYEAIYKKPLPSNPLIVKKQLLKYHENILIFYVNQSTFNPQTSPKKDENRRKNKKDKYKNGGVFGLTMMRAGDGNRDFVFDGSIINIRNRETGFHPTQKPVALLEYLIKTYTLENETVLDNTMGSGSTGVACRNLNRNFIGIEKDDKYFDIASKRVTEG